MAAPSGLRASRLAPPERFSAHDSPLLDASRFHLFRKPVGGKRSFSRRGIPFRKSAAMFPLLARSPASPGPLSPWMNALVSSGGSGNKA